MKTNDDRSVNRSALSLHMRIQPGLPRPVGVVVLDNAGSENVRLWQMGNEWGDMSLSFELTREGGVARIVRRSQVYTRNVPSTFELPAGSRHEWPFDLGDAEWDADALAERPMDAQAQLVAVYAVPESPEALSHGVWTGQLRTLPVRMDPSPPDPRRSK